MSLHLYSLFKPRCLVVLCSGRFPVSLWRLLFCAVIFFPSVSLEMLIKISFPMVVSLPVWFSLTVYCVDIVKKWGNIQYHSELVPWTPSSLPLWQDERKTREGPSQVLYPGLGPQDLLAASLTALLLGGWILFLMRQVSPSPLTSGPFYGLPRGTLLLSKTT